MKRRGIGRLAIGIVLVAIALSWLVFAGTRQNLVYYYEVDELLAASDRYDGKIRISGDVAAGTIKRDEASHMLRFAVTDRKSTRLNSSHLVISYAVFCLKKKNGM